MAYPGLTAPTRRNGSSTATPKVPSSLSTLLLHAYSAISGRVKPAAASLIARLSARMDLNLSPMMTASSACRRSTVSNRPQHVCVSFLLPHSAPLTNAL